MAGNALVPDGSELGTSYQVLAANMIDSTYNLRKVLTNQDSRAMESPKIFADVLAVNTMKAYASMHPGKGPLSATTSEQRLGNGTTEYRVALHDRLGGGITYAVDSDLSVRVTSAQGSPEGRTVSLPTDEFRWNGHGRPNDGYLEHAVSGPDRKAVYVPYANPSLSGGDDLEGGAKLILDQGLSSFGAGKNSRPLVLIAAEATASHEGVRAVSDTGEFGKLKDGYSQEGPIRYNGFSVVEQSGSHGESIYYNKHDLLRNAKGRPDFDHAIESGKPIDIAIQGESTTARVLDSRVPDLHVFRNGKAETLSTGFSQIGKLHDHGSFVSQETDVNGHKSYTMFSKEELFANRGEHEIQMLNDAIKKHQSVTIDLSHHAVEIHSAEHTSPVQSVTRTHNLSRGPSHGIDMGGP